MSRITIEELEAFLDAEFPQARALPFRVDELGDGFCRLGLPIGEDQLRPGATVSGPTLMSLADTAMYFAVMTRLGLVAQTVTTHLSIDFLRRPTRAELTVECRLLKLGRTLAVGAAYIYSQGVDEPVAHASVTYAVPPQSLR